MWTLRFDGLYEPRFTDRGVATYGFVVERDGALVHEESGVVVGPGEGGSANVAEFGAMIRGLLWLREHKADDAPLAILGDSRLAIETVAGRWSLESARLLPLRDLARRLVDELGGAARVSLAKVPRDANARADALTRDAYRRAKEEHPEWFPPRAPQRS